MIDFIEVLRRAVGMGASDIHIVIGNPPMVRIHGEMLPIQGFPIINYEESHKVIYSFLYENQRKEFETNLELDSSLSIPDLARFRVNVFRQKNGIEAVLRVISSKIPSPEELGLTPTILQLTDLPKGLVLVTGPTGSGKSTTLACLIDQINSKKKCNIITIEDPIEYVYENKMSTVRQREIGSHTHTFSEALKRVLRQDPDVILIGEMRDLETISTALTVAETGHLAFGTLHTTDAPQTVERIIDVFPPYQQQQIRTQLAGVLEGVISQILVPKADGHGVVAAREIMIVTSAISNLIREGKGHMIYNALDTGLKYGMISMDKSLLQLVKDGKIKPEVAISKATNPDLMKNALHGSPSKT
ncbi:MAG: type IV pilus twitching motility protein PilT [bacterium]